MTSQPIKKGSSAFLHVAKTGFQIENESFAKAGRNLFLLPLTPGPKMGGAATRGEL
jgi:hypothetical protein